VFARKAPGLVNHSFRCYDRRWDGVLTLGASKQQRSVCVVVLWHDTCPPAGQPDEARGNNCAGETSNPPACAIPRNDRTETVQEESIAVKSSMGILTMMFSEEDCYIHRRYRACLFAPVLTGKNHRRQRRACAYYD
jgi:hypothetical protein